MNLNEKVAYLKGLSEGLEFDADSKESKLFRAIIDALGDVAEMIEDIDGTTAEANTELEDITERVESLEAYVLDLGDLGFDDDDFDDDDFDDDDDDDDDEWCDCDDDDDAEFSVECGKCGEVITIGEEDLYLGSIKCPKCGETLEFEFDDADDE
jgi:hypothetical protein